jgi:hypothetical protein
VLDRRRERIPVLTAVLAVATSALLRLPWVGLIVIAPHTATGAFAYYLMLAAAGVVFLHWCLGWFDWSVSFRAAFAARVLPGLTAAIIASVLGFGASLGAILALAVAEFLAATWIVSKAAARPEDWIDTRVHSDEPRLLISDGLDYITDLSSLVRAARVDSLD